MSEAIPQLKKKKKMQACFSKSESVFEWKASVSLHVQRESDIQLTEFSKSGFSRALFPVCTLFGSL